MIRCCCCLVQMHGSLAVAFTVVLVLAAPFFGMLILMRLLLNVRSFALESFMLHLFLGHYWVFFLIVVSAHSVVLIGDFSPHGKNFWNNGDFIRQQKTIVFSFGTAEKNVIR